MITCVLFYQQSKVAEYLVFAVHVHFIWLEAGDLEDVSDGLERSSLCNVDI